MSVLFINFYYKDYAINELKNRKYKNPENKSKVLGVLQQIWKEHVKMNQIFTKLATLWNKYKIN